MHRVAFLLSAATYLGYCMDLQSERELWESMLASEAQTNCHAHAGGCCIPEDPSNGRVLLSSTDPKTGAYATFTCDQYYRISGTVGNVQIKTLICQGNNEWNGPVPSCDRYYCPKPEMIKNGYVVGYNKKYLVGTSVVIACDPGYRVEGHAVIRCLGADTFEHKIGECVDIKADWCHKIMVLQNGYHTANSDMPHGTIAHFYCNAGYERFGIDSAKCNKGDWEWDGLLPYCSKSGEMRLSEQPFFTVTKKHGGLPPQIKLPPRQKYVITSSVKDPKNGVGKTVEMKPLPYAEGDLCPKPWIRNGKAIYRHRKIGSRAAFFCDRSRGFILKGPRYLYCNHNAKWAGMDRPECVKALPDVTEDQFADQELLEEIEFGDDPEDFFTERVLP